MAGSSFGTIFRITTWGESHGKGLGAVIDGCPSNLPLCEADIQTYLDRRKPGQNRFTTPRKETDQVEILSGVFEDRTTGTPISLWIPNENQLSKDYSTLSDIYRPGHADYTFDAKYHHRDHRGGGRSSGRETLGRVAGGAIAGKILSDLGITIRAYTKSIGAITVPETEYQTDYQNPLSMPNDTYAEQAAALIDSCREHGDSIGGIIECTITGMPPGIGDPVFDKLDADLARAIFSIGAVKGFEIGDGFAAAASRGSQNNDAFQTTAAGTITKQTNHAGGILGGMSDGTPIILRAAIKPTPSITQPQETIDTTGASRTIRITGRHDPCIVPRAVVVVESMVALTLVDALLQNQSADFNNIRTFYNR